MVESCRRQQRIFSRGCTWQLEAKDSSCREWDCCEEDLQLRYWQGYLSSEWESHSRKRTLQLIWEWWILTIRVIIVPNCSVRTSRVIDTLRWGRFSKDVKGSNWYWVLWLESWENEYCARRVQNQERVTWEDPWCYQSQTRSTWPRNWGIQRDSEDRKGKENLRICTSHDKNANK